MSGPNPNDRPSMNSARRRDWKEFLLGEWSLLLLAAALSVIIWLIVRANVLKDYKDQTGINDVEVRVLVEEHNRDSLAAVITSDNRVDLELRCSPREKEEVVAQLKKDGWRVDMLVRQIPTTSRLLSHKTDPYQWKFADERILQKVRSAEGGAPQPQGTVFRIEPRRVKVRLAEPPTIPATKELDDEHGFSANIKISPNLVDLLLPVEAGDEALFADPIDLRKLLDEPGGTPPNLALTFRTWRSESSTAVPEAYRRQLVIPQVMATITLVQMDERTIKNDLRILIDAKKYEYDLGWRRGVDRLSGSGDLKFEGRLKGPTKLLDRLEKNSTENRKDWCWALRLKDESKLPKDRPPAGTKPVPETLEAEIVFIATGALRGCGAEFQPLPNQASIDIKVGWHSKHKEGGG